jgi:hypothetical protein
MEKLGIPLTVEILYYDPINLYALSITSKTVRERLVSGIDYFHTLSETMFGVKTQGVDWGALVNDILRRLLCKSD